MKQKGFINTVDFQCPACGEACDAAYDNFELVGGFSTAPRAITEHECEDCGAEFEVEVDLST